MRTRALAMIGMLAALAPFSSGYYYYTLLNNSGGVWTPIPARFDLNPADAYGLPNNTVTYLIANQGPATLMPGDSFQAVISQIRAAANVWNSVNTSGIQLAFGGLSPMTSTETTPQIDVVFTDQMPPGLIAQTQVTTVQNAASLASATFVPIVNSTVQLRSDLTKPYPQPSWSDAFFLTIAHEFGHALGLQHTKTSSLMTTSLTRAVTKAKPLAADDIAGISLLYATNGLASATGTIAGTVSMGGNGVNLATVVALSTNGTAVSALTNPDGTYRIGAVPPGQYYVYTQPLPPAQSGEAYPDNVKPPSDLSGNVYAANTGFVGQFYGGTNDWTQAQQVTVTAANVSSAVNFNVAPSNGPSVYDLVLYSYIGASPGVPVQAPPLVQGSSAALEFYAWSTTTASGYMQFAPGLNISVIGGAAQIVPNSLAALPSGYPYLYDYVWLGSLTSPTPGALSVTINGDLYVLPAAFTVVPSNPVTITSVTGNTDGNGNATVTVTGSNLSASSQIFFDGVPATLISANSNGSLTVAAPPATNGYTASVEALNPDGQTSEQTLGTNAPPQFIYGGPAFPAITVNHSNAAAGTDQEVTITGYNTNFVSGQVAVGFGSSDVTVKQIWVVSPQRLMLNVSLTSSAPVESTTVTVASGLQLATLSAGFQVGPASSGTSLRTPILNQATGMAGVPIGGVAVINTSGLPPSLSGWILTIGGQTAQYTYNGSQILATVPSGLVIGPQVVQLTASSGASPAPVVMQVDASAPVIAAVANASGIALSASQLAIQGQTILITVDGLPDPLGNFPAASAITVTIGGVNENPISVTPISMTAAQLQVIVPATLASGNAQATVQLGTRISAPFTIPVQ